MVRWRIREILPGVTLAAALAAACGGQSVRSSGDSGSEDDDGGTTAGGTGGTGGTNTPGGTGVGGRGQCVFDGRVIDDGTGFRHPDGCNTCFCSAGEVTCTLLDCPQDACSVLGRAFQESLEIAKRCVPGTGFQCGLLVSSALECGCLTFVNGPAGVDALEQLTFMWEERSCHSAFVTCGACPPNPIGAFCSNEGVCVDSYRE
jgi:hypothetical protein